MEEVFLELIVGEISLCLREYLYLMHEKYKVPVSLLIEKENAARHHERLSCPCCHIEEERFTSFDIATFPVPDEVFHSFFLVFSEFFRWMDIIGDIVRERSITKYSIFRVFLYLREEKIPQRLDNGSILFIPCHRIFLLMIFRVLIHDVENHSYPRHSDRAD